jgi:hypothetical protein
MYHLLFESAHHAIHEVTKDPKWLGAKPGIISILHTWGQDLTFHPHIHCIVSGGGLDKDGKWVRALRDNGKFFVPQTLLEKAYKTYMTTQINKQIASKTLQLLDEKSVNTLLDEVKKKRWNIYAKAPFAGPSEIVEYLGRYTHKVAITPHRILNITNTEITFKYKDYADNHQQKEMTLSNEEFVRRYEQHILPKNFVRIRHAGYLCHRGKKERIVSILTQLNLPKPAEKVLLPIEIKVLIRTGTDISICPKCKEGKLVRIATYLQHNGALVNINDLRNRGSPKRLIIVIPNA